MTEQNGSAGGNRRLRIDGPVFIAALDAIRPPLSEAERRRAINDANSILIEIINCYENRVAVGEVGPGGVLSGRVLPADLGNSTGLVYGRIQSGKTRAMITTSALAFDNGFKIVVIVTTNNTRLVDQTRREFETGLPGRIRFYTYTHLTTEDRQARQILTTGTGYIVLVCAKGSQRLNQVIDFLTAINADRYPAIIFDDEGDQATLDTNVRRRSRQDPDIEPSTIHRLIHSTDHCCPNVSFLGCCKWIDDKGF